MTINSENFKKRLLNQELLVGSFQKTPSMMIAEVLASTEIDFMCIDAEHSPFDRRDIDASVFAYRAANKASLVRVPSHAPEQILNALDCGATGVVVPHVDSVEKAQNIAKATCYGDGGRGYAGSHRAAKYAGQTIEQNIKQNANNVLIAQIEDLVALESIDEIAQVDGIDCLFIGLMDLTVALGCTSSDNKAVTEAAEHICAAANRANRRVGIFVPDLKTVPKWQERGVSLFMLSSEHSFIKQGISHLLSQVK